MPFWRSRTGVFPLNLNPERARKNPPKNQKSPAKKISFEGQSPLGKCPRCEGNVFASESDYLCEHSQRDTKPCKFKSGKVVLQQAVEEDQIKKLLDSGRTDFLKGFVSKTRLPRLRLLLWLRAKVKWVLNLRPARKDASDSDSESLTQRIMGATDSNRAVHDPLIDAFLEELRGARAASDHTCRNYAQTLNEFVVWHQKAQGSAPDWKALDRDSFRAYLRFLGRKEYSRSSTQIRFSALRTFYKFLIRKGRVRRISYSKYPAAQKKKNDYLNSLTPEQIHALLEAPSQGLG